MEKKRLNFWQILTMNFGFFGVQFSFGLQQSNMSAIYKYLGAEEAELPLLWLAGPVTGLIVQPIIGAISDGTWSPKFGRRKPFFFNWGDNSQYQLGYHALFEFNLDGSRLVMDFRCGE